MANGKRKEKDLYDENIGYKLMHYNIDFNIDYPDVVLKCIRNMRYRPYNGSIASKLNFIFYGYKGAKTSINAYDKFRKRLSGGTKYYIAMRCKFITEDKILIHNKKEYNKYQEEKFIATNLFVNHKECLFPKANVLSRVFKKG